MRKPATVSHVNPAFTLPQEIMGVIIDELASQREDDIECMDALRTCLLVSRSFYYGSRKWIFYKIDLDFYMVSEGIDNYQSARFRAILDGNPDLAKRVRVLSLNLYSTWALDSPNTINDLQERANMNFPVILEMLSGGNLHTMELEGRDALFNFDLFTDQMLASLLAIRCNPSFRTLVLKYLDNLPRPLLTGIPAHDRLRKLWIQSLGLGSAETNSHRRFLERTKTTNSPAYPPIAALLEAASTSTELPLQHLEALEVDEPPDFMEFVQSFDRPIPYPSIPFNTLRSLSIGRDTEYLHFAQTNEFLLKAPNITTLCLEASIDIDTPVPHPPDGIESIDLGSLRSLKLLRFTIIVWHHTPNQPISMIHRLFRQIKSPVNIESLAVSLAYWFLPSDGESSILDPVTEWAELDEIVTSWRLPSLRKITISFRFQYGWRCGYTSDQLEEKARLARDLARRLLPRVSIHGRRELDLIVETGIDSPPGRFLSRRT